MHQPLHQIAKRIRQEQGIKTSVIASVIGATEKSYVEWEEEGRDDIGLLFIVKLAYAFQMSVIDLLTYKGNTYYGER